MAPWTDDQVASLNGYQAAWVFHPYTCGTDGCPRRAAGEVLTATRAGWECPCGYRQAWAQLQMADWSWQRPADVLRGLYPPPGEWPPRGGGDGMPAPDGRREAR